MSTSVPTSSCSPGEVANALASALASGSKVAMLGAEDRPSEGIIEVYYVLANPLSASLTEFTLSLDRARPHLDSLARLDFSTGRFEREIADQFGVSLIDHPQPARLVKHAHWPDGYHPLRHDANAAPGRLVDDSDYPFVEVQGDAIYEIGVGPVHAGIIEPGHFRFSAVGESIIAMKARLWFVHRGIESVFEGRSFNDAITLAEKISGDTSVGHSLAMAQAIEDAIGIELDQQTQLTRQLLLDMERVYNLIGDVGAIANDVGFSVINAFMGTQREYALRENRRITGHRLLRGALGIGSASLQAQPDPHFFANLAAEVDKIVQILTGNVMAIDRFKGTGILSEADARSIGCVGYVAYASGLAFGEVGAPGADPTPFNTPPDTVTRDSHRLLSMPPTGDVAARLGIRITQLQATLAHLADLAARLSYAHLNSFDPIRESPQHRPSAGRAVGIACLESWRGRLTHRVVVNRNQIVRAKIVDPSFLNWPAVSISLRGAVVADFPLINKSFNLSYAGNDL
ncbi:MAG: NADH-quinone oxidoreductase subunit C [Ferrimicrobium sp.]|jgi:Ni,Fe-hydrogenase III large subunit/Ni,Fe-hydrogenase III component G|nr:NADH-quinone oxidoreductase subunit C [Ferrimicrobium sp.]